MKGKFYAPSSLMQLDETLKEHKPYAALVVSTTGLDSNAFSDHSPTRVCLKQFDWNEETKSYKEAFSFDKMVKAPQAAVDEAIKNAGSYDAFANGGIDRDAYQRGENVLSQEDFRKEFASVIAALKQDDSVLIINGTRSFAEQYLGKIGCADGISDLAASGKLLEQTRLTQEYFQKEGISGRADLETLRNSLLRSPTGSFIDDEQKMQDFRRLSKEDFLKAHPDVTEKKYFLTEKDVSNRTSKIIGGDKRIDVINDFITKRGRDEHILESEWQSRQRESDAAYVSGLSEKGKQRYRDDSFSDKLGCLIEKGVISPDNIMHGNSEFQKLVDMMEDKNNKGCIVIHAASTGFDFNAPAPRSTGFPIQFSAVCYERKNGEIDFSRKPTGCEVTIAAPARDVLRAEANITDKRRPYNTFLETGISLEDYKQGKGVTQPQEAAKQINDFFRAYPPDSYPIVAIGGTKGSEHSFAQTCMSNLANFAMCEAPYIDFAQVIKEYAFVASHDDVYPKNVLFDEEKLQGKSFSLRDVALARGNEPQPGTTGNPLNSTSKMCVFTAQMMNLLEQQQIELFRSDELAKETPVNDAKTAQPLQDKDERQEADTVKNAPAPELSEDEAFIEGNGYDNIEQVERDSEEELTPEEELTLNKAQIEDFAEHIDIISRDGAEHGRLYSDKQNDSVPIVEADNVRKIGDAPVPHISEAKEDAEDKIRSYRRDRAARRPLKPVSPEAPNNTESNPSIARLVEIIAAQSEIIQNQSSTISQMNEKLVNLLQEQNRFMEAVVEGRAQEAPQPAKAYDAKDNGSVIDFMETIKEQISDLREQLPSERAKAHLSQANRSLSDGQKEIERTDANRERSAS